MAATTISTSGLVLTNDTGTAASPNGDGTVLNAALWALLLTRINGCFSGAFTIGGVFGAEGFGSHTLSAGGTGANALVVRNTTAGAANYAGVAVGNDASAGLSRLLSMSSSYTTSGAFVANGTVLEGNGAGGVSIASTHASGTIRAYTNGTLRSTWGAAGALTHHGGFGLDGVANVTVSGNTELNLSLTNAFLHRITSAASTPVITSILGGNAGNLILITNASGGAVTIAHESGAAGDPDRRFACPGNSNVGIDDGDTVLCVYSGTDSRWIVVGI